ncbi:MAG: NAD(+)/NADH kinase [Christensenellales bacterium]
MKFGIFSNPNRDSGCKACYNFIDVLRRREVEFMVCDNADKFFESSITDTIDKIAEWCDVFVAFGGDGTMLEVVNACAFYDKPLLGVNMGKIGFLSEINANIDEMKKAVDAILSGNFALDSRMLLQVDVQGKTFYALNEALFGGVDNCHVVTVDIAVDGNFTDKMRGDGVIVSTPTGSTAYSLACNGPILSPDVDAILINMVCPHSLHSCPLVVNGNSVVTLSGSKNNSPMRLIIDGSIVANFDKSVVISIQKSIRHAKFITMNNVNFYQKLIKKLGYWGEINE